MSPPVCREGEANVRGPCYLITQAELEIQEWTTKPKHRRPTLRSARDPPTAQVKVTAPIEPWNRCHPFCPLEQEKKLQFFRKTECEDR